MNFKIWNLDFLKRCVPFMENIVLFFQVINVFFLHTLFQ